MCCRAFSLEERLDLVANQVFNQDIALKCTSQVRMWPYPADALPFVRSLVMLQLRCKIYAARVGSFAPTASLVTSRTSDSCLAASPWRLPLSYGTDWQYCVQARLEAQQKRLQKRLKLALQMHHLPPRTSVDTMTVADKIVSALDKLAEVCNYFTIVGAYDIDLWKTALNCWFGKLLYYACRKEAILLRTQAHAQMNSTLCLSLNATDVHSATP